MNSIEKKEKIKELIAQGEMISKEELHIAEPGLCILDYIDGPKFDNWMREIKIFSSRYLSEHELYDDIMNICQKYKRQHSPYENMTSNLKVILEDDEFWKQTETSTPLMQGDSNESNTDIKDAHSVIKIVGNISDSNINIGDGNKLKNVNISNTKYNNSNQKKERFFDKHPVITGVIISVISGLILMLSFWNDVVNWIEGVF